MPYHQAVRPKGSLGAWERVGKEVRFSIGRCLGCYIELGGGFKYIHTYLLFSPLPGEMMQFDAIWLYNIFTKGLVQPPTSEYPTI